MTSQDYMLQALDLAEQGQGQCVPNPAVGAVIVSSQQVVGAGYHHGPGQPHAEIEALQQAGDQAKGASLYVTLEPCCHYGRTPPCTDALINAGIQEVIYGYPDPNPQVAGQGAAQLQQAGVHVEFMPLDAIDTFYHSYAFWWQHQRPWVILKLAMSLDGKIAGPEKQTLQITGEQCYTFTHEQRRKADAILTTVNTIIHDNPKMNVRLHDTEIAKPVYIIDPQLRLPLAAQIWSTAKNITLFYAETADIEVRRHQCEARGARCIPIMEHTPGRLHLLQLLNAMGEAGIHTLWVEAGGCLSEALLEQQLVGRAYFYIAPLTLGNTATTAFTNTQYFNKEVRAVQWQSMGIDSMCQLDW